MSASKSVFVCLLTIFVFSFVQSTEFVPCFIWSNKRTNDRVPALNKISQDIFKEGIQKFLKDDSIDLVVIFAEQTLSPEDFAQHDQSGVIFSNLAKLSKSTKVSYLPYVQNPIKALKHLDVTVTEVPVDKLGNGFEIPETDILVVNLNDVKDNEIRNDLLRRHDKDITYFYQELTKSGKNILCIYTAHHTSWVASEEVVRSRQRRSLMQVDETAQAAASENETKPEKKEPKGVVAPPSEEEPTPAARADSNGPNFFSGEKFLLYVNSFKYTYENTAYNATSLSFTLDSTNAARYVLTATVASTHTITLSMGFTYNGGYWTMENLVNGTITNTLKAPAKDLKLASGAIVEAPNRFSYHCGDQIFADSTFKATLRDFQIQIFFPTTTNATKFDEAYDCVGFTSVPIWSGLFVTTILLIIMTLGITMMMDIRTMDKFDDAKGKTITINAE